MLDGTNGCDPDECLEAGTSPGTDEFVALTGTAGQVYYIVVDGQYGSSTDDYSLIVECARSVRAFDMPSRSFHCFCRTRLSASPLDTPRRCWRWRRRRR